MGSFVVRKGAWTEEEDILLRQCIEKFGEGRWHQVPLRAGSKRERREINILIFLGLSGSFIYFSLFFLNNLTGKKENRLLFMQCNIFWRMMTVMYYVYVLYT